MASQTTAAKTGRGPFDQAWLRADLESMVESFHLSPEQDHFLRSRWLENVLWMEAAAQRTRTRYYALRLTTVGRRALRLKLAVADLSADALRSRRLDLVLDSGDVCFRRTLRCRVVRGDGVRCK